MGSSKYSKKRRLIFRILRAILFTERRKAISNALLTLLEHTGPLFTITGNKSDGLSKPENNFNYTAGSEVCYQVRW